MNHKKYYATVQRYPMNYKNKYNLLMLSITSFLCPYIFFLVNIYILTTGCITVWKSIQITDAFCMVKLHNFVFLCTYNLHMTTLWSEYYSVRHAWRISCQYSSLLYFVLTFLIFTKFVLQVIIHTSQNAATDKRSRWN